MTTTRLGTDPVPPTGAATAHIESWRVVVQADGGTAATADATIRIRANGVRVIANGEGVNPVAALEDGLSTALTEVAAAGCSLDESDLHALHAQSGLPLSPCTDGTPLCVWAAHDEAMLTRLAAQLGPHEVDQFTYSRTQDGRAHITLSVRGGAWQVERVAAKLRRLVGVLDVVVDQSR